MEMEMEKTKNGMNHFISIHKSSYIKQPWIPFADC